MKNIYLFDALGNCFSRRNLPDTVPLDEFVQRTGAANYAVSDSVIEVHSARLVDGALAEVKPAERVLGYREKRFQSYPPLNDQLDALWHAMDSGLIAKVPDFYNPIAAVKSAYPKES